MALILPLLIAIMFGGFEAGAYLWTEHKVVKGVRDGARFAGRQSFASFDCAAASLDSAIVTQVQELTRTGALSGGTAKVAGWVNDDVDVDVVCEPRVDGTYTAEGLYVNQAGGAIHVTVSTTVNYPSFFGTIGFDTSGAVVKSSANAAVMGS